MKKISILTALLCVFATGVAMAGQSNTGCGIGSMIWEGQEGTISQACAVTTNGTFGNQTFGITSGTLNCDRPASFVRNEQIERFVGDNMDALALDISRGSGDYLLTLAVLLDVPVEQRADFYATLQSNFSSIYSSDGVTHLDVLQSLETLLQG